MSLNFDELWQRLIQYDETVEMEVKSAEQAAGNSIMETISAFSNEPGRGGGYLLLGVALDETGLFTTYRITGVKDTDKVQAELATRCRTAFNIAQVCILTREHQGLGFVGRGDQQRGVSRSDPRRNPRRQRPPAQTTGCRPARPKRQERGNLLRPHAAPAH